MARFHSVLDVVMGQETDVPYTAEEEVAADAAEALANRPRISKALVRDRLTEAQRIQALGLMSADQRARWYDDTYPTVFADDPELLQMMQTMGLNPAVFLAA